MAENWDIYIREVEGAPALIAVNLGLIAVTPVASHPHLVAVALHMIDPREDGLAERDEDNDKEFYDLEDALSGILEQSWGAIHSGRMTSSGKRTLSYYLPSVGALPQKLKEFLDESPFKWSIQVKEDKSWGFYRRFLYPTPREYQSIMNRRVCDQLVESEDRSDVPREVEHWVYFAAPGPREEMVQFAVGLGYFCESRDLEKGPKPFELRLRREDTVEYAHINGAVLQLWEKAGELGGEYDGWESPVVRAEDVR